MRRAEALERRQGKESIVEAEMIRGAKSLRQEAGRDPLAES